MRPPDPPDKGERSTSNYNALLSVDDVGRVRAVVRWPWLSPPCEGEALAEHFDGTLSSHIEALIIRGWFGASDQRWQLANGLWVTLSVDKDADCYWIWLTDVTAQEVIGRASEQRRQMRALSELAGSVSRELTDPMSIVQGRLELLLDLGVADPQSVRRHLDVALEHARRASVTLRNLRLVGRLTSSISASVPFADIARETHELLGPRRDKLVVKSDPEDLIIGCDGALVARVLASLVRQCMDALSRSMVELCAHSVHNRVEIRIGPSGRPRGEEINGWEGLQLHQTLLASIGGEVIAYRTGLVPEFIVRLPGPAVRRSRRRSPHTHVLVVGLISSRDVPDLLERDGYSFTSVKTAAEALIALDDHPIEIVVTDLVLEGGVSGLALVEAVSRRLAENAPKLIVIGEGQLMLLPPPFIAVSTPMMRAELLDALTSDPPLGRSPSRKAPDRRRR